MRGIVKTLRWLPAVCLLFSTLPLRAEEAPQCSQDVCTQNFDSLVQTDTHTLISCAHKLRNKPLPDPTSPAEQSYADLVKLSKQTTREISCFSNGRDISILVLSQVERALRKQGDALEDAIAAEKKVRVKSKKAAKSRVAKKERETTKATDDQSQEKDEATLKDIEKTVYFSEKGLFVNAEKYDDYFFRLNTGYEFVAVDRFFDKGEPRISLLVNSRLGGRWVTDALDGFSGLYGGRLSFTSQLESSAEVTPTLPQDMPAQPQSKLAQTTDTPTDSTEAANAKVTKTFSFELQGTWVFYRTRVFSGSEPEDASTTSSANLRHYLGLIGVAGGLKTDDQPKIATRTYAGLRWAINPELYTDVLYGHTSGLASNRFEIRGQLPVYTLASGDKVYLGGIGNFGINKRRRTLSVDADGNSIAPKESDAVRIYLTWNADLKKLLGQS